MKAAFVWSTVFSPISIICFFNLLPCEASILVFCSCALQRGLCVFIVNRQAGQDYSLVSSFRNCNSCNLTCGHRPFFEFHQNKGLNFDCDKKRNAHSKCKVQYKRSFHSFVKTLHGSCCETMPDDSLFFTSICHRDIFSWGWWGWLLWYLWYTNMMMMMMMMMTKMMMAMQMTMWWGWC